MVPCVGRNYLNKHRSSAEQYILHIYSNTPVNEESVKTRIAEYFSHGKKNITYAIQKLTVKQISLCPFGLLVLALWLFLSESSDHFSIVKPEILSIIGWVAIWEATSIATMERPGLVALKKSYDRIINARIVIDVVSRQGRVDWTGREAIDLRDHFAYLSNHPVISFSLRRRCAGLPVRESSWFSPWKTTILAGTFR